MISSVMIRTGQSALARLPRSALHLVRRGSRMVSWTDPTGNLGNFLYHWMRAARLRSEGVDAFALRTPAMTQWESLWPGPYADLTLARDAVRLTDRREIRSVQCWGGDYFPFHVEGFAKRLVAESTQPMAAAADPERIVINVRRGDFYTTYRHRYAFDVTAYVSEAMRRSEQLSGAATTLHVVSDDIPWCREHLRHLEGPRVSLTFSDPAPDPHRDLVTLATARRLILTNSTFGYWAAHLSNAVHGDNHADVVVPWLHDRATWEGAAYQLNPAWTVIRTIPNGWGPPPD